MIMIIQDNVYLIDSKTRIDQELKFEGQGHKPLFSKMDENRNF